MRRLALYCDESGISGDHKHYGFGAVIMQYQRRGQLVQEHRDIAGRRDWGEVKWNKTNNFNLKYYCALIDHFFRSSWLYFHCIVVERAWVKVHTFHEGSYDLARRKHFTKFLANKVKRIVALDPARTYEFRVYVDPIASSYRKADEAVQVIGNRMVNQGQPSSITDAAIASRIEKVLTVDSADRPEIQVCDLLLGAIVDSWNQGSSRAAKLQLKQHIAQHLGWNDLCAGTFARERKFNVWWLTDQFRTNAERPVLARPVRLKHPLPPRRPRSR